MTAEHTELIEAARPFLRNITLGRPDWDAATARQPVSTLRWLAAK